MNLKAIDAAREFAERNRIANERDWDSQPWFNKHQVYTNFKAQLAQEVEPASRQWRPAVQALAEVLHV